MEKQPETSLDQYEGNRFDDKAGRSRDRESRPNRVFVGNLAFKTSWRYLKDYMRKAGDAVFVDIFTDGMGRSKGCGLVEFSSLEDAKRAIAELNGTELDGREIYVRQDDSSLAKNDKNLIKSGEGRRTETRDYANQTPKTAGSQLIVLNLPWSTTWQQLKDAFKEFGRVARADVPVDRNGRSSGRGFVSFENESDAQAAIDAMNDTDFEGRVITVKFKDQ